MIYDVLHNLEKHIPHNMAETRTQILMPTYRFATSANFVIGIIAIVLLLAIILLPSAFAYDQKTIDRKDIQNIVVHDLNNNATFVTFEYCFNKYTLDTVGAFVTSDLDAVPIQIELDAVDYRKCAVYGAKILAESAAVTVTLLQQDKIDALISAFNIKIHDLKDSLASIEQKINQYKKLDYGDDKIRPLKQQSDLLEKQIQSAKLGLKTLIVMKNS